MIVKLEENLTQEDIEVLIKYARMNHTVNRLVSLIKSVDSTVKCNSDQRELWVNVSDIYYIESVDKKTFVYCDKSVYGTEYRLYQLMDELEFSGFVQISKSCLININVLESLRPLMNSRMEATLSNGERIAVTRKYVANIKAKLQER
jgi:DNA-binding LytR/AlgR family response regulator